MNVVSPSEAWAIIRSRLERDAGQVFGDEPEALTAALLRRAAAVRCPCPPSALVDGIADAILELAPESMMGRERVDEVFDSLIASGDLLLGRADDQQSPELLVYLAPPSYVRRMSGTVFLLGGLPDVGLPLPEHLSTRPVSRGCYRQLSAEPGEDLESHLNDLGFLPYPLEAWVEAPTHRAAAALISDVESRLADSGRAGDIPDLQVMDSDRPSSFYRRRWASPGRRTGRFIARRPKRWGAPLWCYVELVNGEPTRILDFPCVDTRFRGCDEAWWVQCAIDATRGQPQILEVRTVGDGFVRVSTQTPLPMWAERRILLVGQLHPQRDMGALLSFSLQEQEAEEEISFLSANLWLDVQRTP